MLTMFGSKLFITRRARSTGNSHLRKLMLSAAIAPYLLLPSQPLAYANDLDFLLEAEEAAITAPQGAPTNSGISISVDGEAVLGNPTAEDKIIRTDKNLEAVDIQIKYDGLDVTRRLNVATTDLRGTYKPGETVSFRGSWNYPDWIERAEVRIYRSVDKYASIAIAQPLTVIEVPTTGTSAGAVDWQSFQGNGQPSSSGR